MSLSVPNQEQALRLRSEEVIVEAPFSFVGAFKRIMRTMMPWVMRTNAGFEQAQGMGEKVGKGLAVTGLYVALVLAISLAWSSCAPVLRAFWKRSEL
jgi:hypothetical protein